MTDACNDNDLNDFSEDTPEGLTLSNLKKATFARTHTTLLFAHSMIDSKPDFKLSLVVTCIDT